MIRVAECSQLQNPILSPAVSSYIYIYQQRQSIRLPGSNPHDASHCCSLGAAPLQPQHSHSNRNAARSHACVHTQQHTVWRCATNILAITATQQPRPARHMLRHQDYIAWATLCSHTARAHRHGSWVMHYLSTLNILALHASPMPDFLFLHCNTDEDNVSTTMAPSSYCRALLSMKWAATTPWQQPIITAEEARAPTVRLRCSKASTATVHNSTAAAI